MIQVEQLSRNFGAARALDGVSFSVEEGEIVGFLGPNGAGKTTAMRILTCSLAPSGGRAFVCGHDVVDGAAEVRRTIGFMPENVPLYPDSTVAELLDYVGRLKGVAGSLLKGHLDDIVQRTGLGAVRGRPVGHLSKGFRQRVGLAQALIGDPPVLILDEPSSGLDPHQIVEIRELIKSFRGRKTVLLSSHILNEVSLICERVLILDQGRLVSQQRPEDLAEKYQTQPRVILAWDGNRDEVSAALAEVTGVDDVVVTDQGAEVVLAGDPVEIRPRLVESVVNAGGLLQNLSDSAPTLEDMFLQLTRGSREEEQ